MKNKITIHLNGNKTIYKYQKWAPELTPWYSWHKYSIKSASGEYNWEMWPAIHDYTHYFYNKYTVGNKYPQFFRLYQKRWNNRLNSKWYSDFPDSEYAYIGPDFTTNSKVPEYEFDWSARQDRCSTTYVSSTGEASQKVEKIKIDGWLAAMSQKELDNFLCYTEDDKTRVGIKTYRGYERSAVTATASSNYNIHTGEADKTSPLKYWNDEENRVNEPTLDCGYLYNYISYHSYLGDYDVEPTVLISTREPNSAVYMSGHYATPWLYRPKYESYPDRKHGYGLEAQDQCLDDIIDPDNTFISYPIQVTRAWVDWKGGGVGNPESYDPTIGVDPWSNGVPMMQGYSTNRQPVPHNPCNIIECEAAGGFSEDVVQPIVDKITDRVNHTGRMYTGVVSGSTTSGTFLWGNANDPENQRYCNFYKQYEEGRYWIVTGDFELEEGGVYNQYYSYSRFKNDVKVYIFTPESYTDGEYLYNVYELPVQVVNLSNSGNTGGFNLPRFQNYTTRTTVQNTADDNYNKIFQTKARYIDGIPEAVVLNEVKTEGFDEEESYYWRSTGEMEEVWHKDDSVASEVVGSDDPYAYPQDGHQDGNWYTALPTELAPNEYIELVWDNENESAYPQDGEQGGYWYIAQGYEYEQHPHNRLKDVWSFTNNEFPNEEFQLGYWYKYIGSESVDSVVLEDDKISTGVKYECNINPDKNLKYGNVAVASVTFSIPDKIAMPIYKNVRDQLIEVEVFYPRYAEWRRMGEFYLHSQKRNNQTVQYTCYDKLYTTSQFKYNPDDWPETVSGVDEYITVIGDLMGVPVALTTFSLVSPIATWVLPTPRDGMTYRELLEQFGAANLCSFKMNAYGAMIMWRKPSQYANFKDYMYNKMEIGTEMQQYIKVENGGTNYVGSVSLDYTVPMTYTFDPEKPRPRETETHLFGQFLHSMSYLPAKIESQFDFLLEVGDEIRIPHPYFHVEGEGITSSASIIIFSKKVDRGIVTFECTGTSNYFE